MKSIMFVCLGNICRSPIAQACAEKLAKEHSLDLTIDSSGTGNWHVGEAPCENSIQICRENNIDISHYRASQFSTKDIESYDLIVALDEQNLQDLKSMGASDTVKLGSYGYASQDVPDPYFFNGYEGFDKVFNIIDKCVRKLFVDEGLVTKQ